jgi:hypothetical protein|tara:strand:- start:1020 stop:1262 length:243 start_codon:yes stop_codon:yes gene_type:complete
MKLNKEDMINILRIMQHNTDTMLEMEEQNYANNKQYMKMEQDLFHEKWKVRFLTRRLREIAPHEALSEEELDEQIKGKQH